MKRRQNAHTGPNKKVQTSIADTEEDDKENNLNKLEYKERALALKERELNLREREAKIREMELSITERETELKSTK